MDDGWYVATTRRRRIELWLRANEVLCPTCGGDGRFDSCFDCGNNGYITKENPRDDG